MSQANFVDVGANAADRARNRGMGAGVVDDPYPVYDALRESGPVHEGAISEHFGAEEMPDTIFWRDRRRFSCYDWKSVDTVLRDDETFSSESYEPSLGVTIGRSIIQMDGAKHRRYRALVQPAFTRKEMERWQERWVQSTLDEILDDMLARGEPADLYAELCARVPVLTIARSFGVAPADVPHFHELAVTATSTLRAHSDRLAAAEEIANSLREVIERGRKEPGDDLIGLLYNVEIEDPEDGSRHRLSDAEILAFARTMLPAGAGTTYRGLGCLLFALLETAQIDRVREDRSLLDAAIEESLRWEQPPAPLARLATRDTELNGLAVPEGSVVNACLASANHDPSRFEDPHQFDIDREQKPHASFGSGPHLCIGMHLARMEMRTAMNAILDRLPGLRFDPAARAPWVTGLLFRMPTAVPVVFDA